MAPSLTPIEHGTVSGYTKHRRRGIPICDPCREANNDRHRVVNLAVSRTMTRIRRRYPGVWRTIYNEELARAKAETKG